MTSKFQRYQLSKASRKFQKDLEKYIIFLDEKPDENQAVKMMDAFGVLLNDYSTKSL